MKLEDQVPTCTIKALKFSIYNPEEIKKLSVLEITNFETFDALGHPTTGGLYDPRLGPTEKDEQCQTCGERPFNCTGHMGHINLPLIVFNPLFITDAFDLLRAICMHCKQLRCNKIANILLSSQLKALQYGLVITADEMEVLTSELIVNEENDLNSTAMQLKIQRFLEDLLSMALEGVDLELAKQNAQVKNVAEYRLRLIKNFRHDHILKTLRNCNSCKMPKKDLLLQHKTRIIITKGKGQRISTKKTLVKSEELEEDDNMLELGQSYLTPLMAKSYLTDVYENEKTLLSQLYSPLIGCDGQSSSPIDGFFIQVLPVPAPRFRPVSFMNGQKYDHPHSGLLSQVIKECYIIQNLVCAQRNDRFVISDALRGIIEKLPGASWQEKLQLSWGNLQQRVNSIFDGELQNSLKNDQLPGVKQLLEKKEGLMRMHMLGKRVNFACRSVISPDPYIDVHEIGVPTVFATILTFPEIINRHNAAELRQAVINGPNVHPGARMYTEDGRTKLLGVSKEQREQVANKLFSQIDENSLSGSKIVHRHLKDGDMLLLNRQPTLHKPSIMAHKARVLKGEKTLRLNYSACKTYNADFDGDEMNCHFPQSEAAKAEAYLIANVENQYLVPKDGTPLGGLIQDHIIGATKLMVRGRFLNREDYQQLVYSAISNKRGNILLLPPTIIKPCCLWSGKQVVSTILINVIPPGKNYINLIGNSKISDKCWLRNTPRKWKAGGSPLQGNSMTENEVIIRHGEILSGILDKAHCGPTPYGLIHCCYELYGGNVASLLLSQLERVFTVFLQFCGFSLGVEDIIVIPKSDKKRREIMNTTEELDYGLIRDALKLPEDADIETIEDRYSRVHLSGDEKLMKDIDTSIKSKTDVINNEINKVCIIDGLLKKFPENNLQLMVISGAKGSSVNCMQISCLLGQIELEGRRPPLMLSGRSLPSFPPYSTLSRAGGFVYGRFLSGIRPQEYFFHCMAGREGLIDTAVKTSRSGYLQRCLIKHLEGLTVAYDMTVRDSDGSVIQLKYGEDGLDICQLQFLKSKQFPFLVENYKSILDDKIISRLKNEENYSEVLQYSNKVRKWLNSRDENVPRFNGFLKFCKKLKKEGVQVEDSNKNKLLEAWFDLEPSERASYNRKAKRNFDPVASKYRGDKHLGAITEKLDAIIEHYAANQIGNFSADKFRDVLRYKCQTAICHPGESVGLLAAQSIGEPSTQMTLNTFHFAGRGEMNVTLGIPRLREILMTGSANIATPSIEVPVLGTCDESLAENGEFLKKRLSRICLSDVLLDTSVHERSNFNSVHKDRTYVLRFNFLPRKTYRKRLGIKPSQILAYMEKTFFKNFTSEIGKHEKALRDSTLLHTASIAKERGGTKEGDSEENEDEGNVTAAPSAERENEEISSDEEDADGENDATEQRNRQRHQQDREYEVDDDEKGLMAENNSDNDEEVDESATEPKIKQESNEIEMESENENEVKEEEINEALQIDESVAARIQTVLAQRYVYSYKYDIKKQEWCELTLKMDIISVPRLNLDEILAAQVKKAIVNHVPGIKKAFMVDQNNANGTCQRILKTDGINIKEMFKYVNMVDLKRLYSNDIHAMAQTYGIEAAARVIVKEVQNVFMVYGIEVDPRHLLLVADYMTFDGFYKAFSRRGMENSVSPLQQMSFETTMHFLKAATLSGTSDRLHNPSSRLVMGRPVGCGTGCFSLLHPIKATPESL